MLCRAFSHKPFKLYTFSFTYFGYWFSYADGCGLIIWPSCMKQIRYSFIDKTDLIWPFIGIQIHIFGATLVLAVNFEHLINSYFFTQYIKEIDYRKPKKSKVFFSGPATKALPPPLPPSFFWSKIIFKKNLFCGFP